MFRAVLRTLINSFFRLADWLVEDFTPTRATINFVGKHAKQMGCYALIAAMPAIMALFIGFAISTYHDPLPATALPGARPVSFACIIVLGVLCSAGLTLPGWLGLSKS